MVIAIQTTPGAICFHSFSLVGSGVSRAISGPSRIDLPDNRFHRVVGVRPVFERHSAIMAKWGLDTEDICNTGKYAANQVISVAVDGVDKVRGE